MYISIKLPPAFGSFNQLRKENYPFNSLFTDYLAAVSRLGLALKMDVAELVGYIEDRIFDGQRLPDVPEGTEPVNIRYKISIPEDAGNDHPGRVVQQYIEGSTLTNRMAVMYIARMTLRLSAAYGTSLFRLTRLITDLDPAKAPKKQKTVQKQEPVAPKPKAEAQHRAPEDARNDEGIPMPRVSTRIVEAEPKPEPVPAETPVKTPSNTADAARAAVSALAALVEPEDADGGTDEGTPIVETNPALADFL